MSIFKVTANGTDMGEYRGETAADALDAYARDAGYKDYANAAAQFGDDATAEMIDIVALTAAVEESLGAIVFQDSYGSGVALVNGVSYATYEQLAKAAGKSCYDFLTK